ncbi:urea ABC transporter ATP-binding protein UrtD [Caldilinea aerophila]|jgi:urea transport system ATP-binding protein|uniref:Putative ABC transporter ATP-binding protein n=1 Tax=Caldilinea aerophila (strain DSM 14535 / JCM 11387 / NBRC 104270 / STL-6-O1) TaxID=926550 RepID=I0HZB4_CALAS|nr:urea ABC transporter ATP-binding protein UrtD [Caldilinea aerophila]BAL98351.1 putative ABC transporter ATP-binding protein [Caldilinea aerophila DSM 14535 = NBRC 104270]
MISNATIKPILHLQDVTVSFDGFRALDGLNFRMNYGELRFVIGPNGAGKTTLLDVLTGKTRPQRGVVIFDGRINVTKTPEHELARQGIARKFQTPTIFPSLTVYENLEVAASFRDGVLGLMRRPPLDRWKQIEEVLNLVRLKSRAFVQAGVLAHGEKQWLEIAMLLIQKPKLLLLDEPVAGMTRAERNRTGELLHTISGHCSVLVVEHDMEFVRNFASQVTVLHLGRCLTQGSVAQIQADPRVIEVYIGRNHVRAALR